MEADALVKEFTGAQVMAMEQDVPALKAMKPGGKEHPNFYDMETKYARLTPGAPDPFIDPQGAKKYVDQKEKEKEFNKMLNDQLQVKGK
jgi:hypothetical protein